MGLFDRFRKKQDEKKVDQNQVLYLKSLMENMQRYQDIINNSDDVKAVQMNLDYLLAAMTVLDSYEEETLREAGLTKVNMSQQREYVLKNYNIVLEQAKERKVLKSVCRSKEISNTKNEVDANSLLKTQLKEAIPTKRGLYPHEVLMLSYAETYKTAKNTFQNFWLYEYDVKSPQAILDSLLEREFIEIGDLYSAISKLKVVELKAELTALELKTTGKKAELIERLFENGNKQLLEQKYSERYYQLTAKGQTELKENDYILYLHRHKYMSIWEMNKRLFGQNSAKLKYRDILWADFNSQLGEYFKAGDMGLYRNVRLDMYQFLMEENKHDIAFKMLCEVIMYDLSGMGNSERFNAGKEWDKYLLQQSLDMNFPYKDSCATLPPAVIVWTAEMKDLLGASEKQFRELLLANFKEICLLRRIFTDEECVEIVMNEIGNHPRKLAAIYQQAEERIKDQLNGI